MEKIIPAKWFLKDLEAVALEWLAGQFTGRAAEKWTRVVAAARVTATTSGIRHNSVLYRCLRDMVLAYPAVGIKAHLQMRRLRDLPWNRKDTVAQSGFPFNVGRVSSSGWGGCRAWRRRASCR